MPPLPKTAANVQVAEGIAEGGSTTVTISTPGDIGLLAFDGTKGQQVSVNLTSGTFSSCIVVSILNPNNSVLASTNLCGSSVFIDSTTLPLTGTYTIYINPQSTATGSVTVSLYAFGDITTSTGENGPPVALNITTPGQNAKVTFSGTTGDRISVNFTNCTFNDLDVTIYNPDGTSLYSGSFGTGGRFIDPLSLPASGLPQTGQYTIFVSPAGAATGSVTLQLYGFADVSASTSINGSATGISISTPGQNGTITFAGSASQSVTVHLTSNSISCVTVSLLSTTGSTITSTHQCASSFNLTQETLSVTGQYSVFVNPDTTDTGSISVAVTSP